jgi:hypothetical protein
LKETNFRVIGNKIRISIQPFTFNHEPLSVWGKYASNGTKWKFNLLASIVTKFASIIIDFCFRLKNIYLKCITMFLWEYYL